MKYTGYIFGFQPSRGSIYNVIKEDYCDMWKALVNAEAVGLGMFINFSWDGYTYQLRMKEIKPDYLTGDVFSDGEVWGNIYAWKYSNKEGLLLRGDYTEEGSNYNVFIELKLES